MFFFRILILSKPWTAKLVQQISELSTISRRSRHHVETCWHILTWLQHHVESYLRSCFHVSVCHASREQLIKGRLPASLMEALCSPLPVTGTICIVYWCCARTKKKLTMASPHLVYKILQTVYSHNPTQCLQVILSKCAVSILHVCCLFMFVLSWVTIYIFMYVCDMWPYGPIWLNMAQFWRSHGSTSTSLMHFITLLWAPRVRRWLNQDPNELFKLSNHALSKFRVRLFRQVSAAAWALMATCCWFCFFLHGFSSWTLFGKHGEFCAAKSVPMLWLDGWGVARYCKILQTIRLRSGWQHDNDFARTSSAVLQSPCSSKADSAKWFTKPFVAPQYVYLPNCTWMDL